MEEKTERRRKAETEILEKVRVTISSINESKHVDEVIVALHSIAVLLFPIDSSLLAGSIGNRFRDKVIEVGASSPMGNDELKDAFYHGAAFPSLARVLIHNLSTNWLPCFPISPRNVVYDSFFVNGPPVEVFQAVVPGLLQNQNEDTDFNTVSFSSNRFTIQLLDGIEERGREISDKSYGLGSNVIDGTFLFVGETFARISRRGSTDILLAEMIPRILNHVRTCLRSNDVDLHLVVSKQKLHFWPQMMVAIRDPYATENLSEQLLRMLAAERSSDIESYWVLWILFHQAFENQPSIRSLFIDKFLLWKVFPVCCLRWILQFVVLKCPPCSVGLTRGENTRGLIERVQCLVRVWSKREFVQTTSVEQQACRLESPVTLVRKMASCVALVFSKVVDPKNPLYLDDSCSGDTIDWEFGFAIKEKEFSSSLNNLDKVEEKVEISSVSDPDKAVTDVARVKSQNSAKITNKKIASIELIDPDEIIDPAALNFEQASDGEDDADNTSENSETASDSSLQPYDMSDDDVDLKKPISQLIDIVGALSKTDDLDGVERALDVAEKLVRALPDELQHISGELVRALVHVRCSDLTIEGEEESAEGKRQKALVALLVMSPLESLVTQTTILDVMTDAAEELSNARSMRKKHQQNSLISTISDTQPWYLPSDRGPSGAGLWKEVPKTVTPLSWSYRYERELPLKPSQTMVGKSRRWSLHSTRSPENQVEWSKNKFPVYAAAFMLPAMQGFDKRRHGVDLLGGDFVVLGKIIYMLGVCMKCTAMHPEASALAPALLDMLSSRQVSHHAEAYVRRSVLLAASCIMIALHPSSIATALVEGNLGICQGLEWIRTWSLHVAESDTDTECSTMAMGCLKLHAEMALQASRALKSTDYTFKTSAEISPDIMKGVIKLPTSGMQFRF
ncbi:hypothetical protein MKX03_029527 [Papaver bracteatum]|nr:hypothetical protein MKX03_029527 [Papaver bracteatum]